MTSNKAPPCDQRDEMDNSACDHTPCQPQVVALPPPDGGSGTKTSRKARNRRGKSDMTELKLYCVPDCKKGRVQSDNMVQCHTCQTWAHYECIDEGEDDIVGIWTCNTCRKMPTMVMQLIDMVAKLRDSMSEMRNANAQLVGILAEQQSELYRLREDLKERLPVSKANTQAEETIDSPSKPTTLLIGNSLLRDVHHPVANDGSDVTVQRKSGATLADLTDMLNEHSEVTSAIIVGGSREILNEATSLDDINDGFCQLIDTAKAAANTVYVCSVLPTSNNKNNERREKVNEMIRETCEEKNATFVNNDLNFTYRDGSCDEAAFVKDGIHLSAYGLSKLLSNVSLSQKTATPRTTTNRPTSRQGPSSQKTRDARVNGPRNGPAACAPRRSVSHNTPAEPAWHVVGQCRKCGESNHVTKKCRHEVAVTCFTCGQKGHKNNHHHHPSR